MLCRYLLIDFLTHLLAEIMEKKHLLTSLDSAALAAVGAGAAGAVLPPSAAGAVGTAVGTVSVAFPTAGVVVGAPVTLVAAVTELCGTGAAWTTGMRAWRMAHSHWRAISGPRPLMDSLRVTGEDSPEKSYAFGNICLRLYLYLKDLTNIEVDICCPDFEAVLDFFAPVVPFFGCFHGQDLGERDLLVVVGAGIALDNEVDLIYYDKTSHTKEKRQSLCLFDPHLLPSGWTNRHQTWQAGSGSNGGPFEERGKGRGRGKTPPPFLSRKVEVPKPS